MKDYSCTEKSSKPGLKREQDWFLIVGIGNCRLTERCYLLTWNNIAYLELTQ